MKFLPSLIGTPLTLSTHLLDRFPELREARFRRGGILVCIGGWCLGSRSVDGITLGRTIWLARHILPDLTLLLHEIRHVQQFTTIRWFPIRYVWQTVRRGYQGNRYEIDARAYVHRRLAHASSVRVSIGSSRNSLPANASPEVASERRRA